MLAKVMVHPPGEFEKWLDDGVGLHREDAAREARGRQSSVSSSAAARSATPSTAAPGSARRSRGLFGHRQPLERRRHRSRVDENYIRESILNPQAKVVAGLRAGDADLPGPAEGQGDRRAHRVHQDAEVTEAGDAMTTRTRPSASRPDAERPGRQLPDPRRAGSARGSSRSITSGSASCTWSRRSPRSSRAASSRCSCAPSCSRRGQTIMDADTYNQIVHAARRDHGVPVHHPGAFPAALGNFVLPLHARRQGRRVPAAEPGELLPVGRRRALAVHRRWSSGGVDTGWTFYTPYSTTTDDGASSPMTFGVVHPRLQLDLHRPELHRHDPQAARRRA